MLPYFIILLTVIIIAFIANSYKKTVKIYNFYKFLILSILTLFAGLRNRSVGTDTSGYVGTYLRKDLDFLSIINGDSRIEFGYKLLENVALIFSEQYVALLITISFVTVYFQLKGIYKLSEQTAISLFVFITFGIYTYVFNGARQALAAGIFVYAMTFLIQGNFKKYVLWIIVASFFHKSVLFGIPLYFLFRTKFSTKLFFFLILATVGVTVFFNMLISYMSLFSEQYAKYQDIQATGGAYLTLAFTLLSLFFVLIRSKVHRKFKKNYDVYLNMFLVGTMIYLIIFFSEAYIEMTRIAFYYILTAMFIWPIIFKSLQQKEIALVFMFFMIVHVFFFYFFIGKMANLNPYIVNPQILNLLQ